MKTDDLREMYGKSVTVWSMEMHDDLWLDDYVLWLEKELLNRINR